MNRDRDIMLQTVFEQANESLDGTGFVDRVMNRTHHRRNRIIAIAFGFLSLVIISLVIMDLSLVDVTRSLSLLVTVDLFNLGDGWASWVFAPVNNIASLLVLGLKGFRVVYKKFLVASYVD